MRCPFFISSRPHTFSPLQRQSSKSTAGRCQLPHGGQQVIILFCTLTNSCSRRHLQIGLTVFAIFDERIQI